MEFFDKLKSKLRRKNLLGALLCLLLSIGFAVGAFSIGFTSELEWQIGPRYSQSGIPVPNWLLAGLVALVAVFCFCVTIGQLHSLIMDSEYEKMMKKVQVLGDAKVIDSLIASMPKSKLAKGADLRFNAQILFCRQGTNVTVLASSEILAVRTEIVGARGSETNYVCVYYNGGILKIRTGKKTVLVLLEELRRTFGVH